MQDSLKQKISDYKIPEKAIRVVDSTPMVFLVGIAGAGKNTILSELLKKPEYKFIVSHTTRPPRSNQGVLEQDGVNYHFIDHDRAGAMLDNHEFIEAKNVHGRMYGTSIEEIESASKEGKIAVTDIDIQGVAEYVKVSDKVTAIFLLPPDFETWQKRLLNRYTDSKPDKTDLKRRMQTAKVELQEALEKDYFEFVINDDLDRTVQAVEDIASGEVSKEKNTKARNLAESLLLSLQSANPMG